jgi:putative ABC transport system permease protein
MSSLWLDLTLALRNVVRQRRRSTIALCAVGFGVVAYLLASGFIEWIFFAMREDTIHSHLGHVQVVRPGYLDAGIAEPFSYLLPENAAERKAIESLPQVKLIAPRLSFSGLANHDTATISFVADGVNPEAETVLSRTVIITEGQDLSSTVPGGIIVGRGLAANLGVKIGDTIVLVVNTPTGGINAAEGRVRGLFSTVTKAYDDSALRLPLPMAQKLLRTDGVHRWVVLLQDTALTEPLLSLARQQLSGKPFEVVPWFELADFYNKTVGLFSKQVDVIRAIIALIIVLSISNTMMMTVMERTGEIGTLMALGSNRSKILRLFVSEGALLGLIGGLVGVLVGVAAGYVISKIGIPMPPPPGMARGFTGEIRIGWGLIVDAFILAGGTTLLASIYPAWKASRMVIVDALRHSR